MTQGFDVKMSPASLWLASSNAEAPSGSLLEADEIVSRNKGSVGPRPGFVKGSDTPGQPYLTRVFPYKGDALALKSDSSTLWAGATVPKDEDNAVLQWNLARAFGTKARDALYLNTKDGMRKVCKAAAAGQATFDGSAGAPRVGLQTPAVILQTQTAGVVYTVPDTFFAAYRAVTLRVDLNKQTTRSAPSGRMLVEGTSTHLFTVRVLLTLSAGLHGRGWLAGDQIELYRTFDETTNPPSDNLYLARTVTLTSTNIAAGYVDVVDTTHSAQLGRSLYTNDTIEGIEGTHLPPPRAGCSALFNGSLWLGNLQYPAQAGFSFDNAPTSPQYVGIHNHTGAAVTSLSAVVTLASTAGIKVGQMVYLPGTWASLPTTVAAVTDATHLLMSSIWTGAGATITLQLCDVIQIAGSTFPVASITCLVANVRGNSGGYSFGAAIDGSGRVIADNESDNQDQLSAPTQNRTYFRLTAHGPAGTYDDAAVVVYATNGAYYDPPLAEPGVGAGYTLPRETITNALAWSNIREPEHFVLANIDEVGARDATVLALYPLVNAMIIATDKGVYRASGFADAGIRFDKVDLDVRQLTPYTGCVVSAEAYIWADYSLYRVNEQAAAPFAQTALGSVLGEVQRTIGPGSVTAAGAWMATNRKANEFLLSVPATSDLTRGERLYVYNANQGTWVNWFRGRGPVTAWVDETNERLNIAGYVGTTPSVYLERAEDTSAIWTADTSYAVTITVVASAAITISAGSGWAPAVGDLLVQGGDTALVTAITDATHFTVDHGAYSAGAATAYEAFTSRITPIAATAGVRGARKLWGEGVISWGARFGLLAYTLGFRSAIKLDSSETTAAHALSQFRITDETVKAADAVRFTTPRAHARSVRLYPSIIVRQAGARWRLEEIAIKFRLMSERIKTKAG